MHNMKSLRISLWLALVAVLVTGLVSCDPISSVDYKIVNKQSDTVTVSMYEAILVSSYGGYSILEGDSVVASYGEDDSISVALLAPDQVLWVHDEWDGLYREERILPLWDFIQSIKSGDNEVPAELWNSEQAWHLNTEGGKRFQGESRYYSLILRDK